MGKGDRRTKRGKTFYGCLKYPACDFVTWNKPVPEQCPKCGSPYLLETSRPGNDNFAVDHAVRRQLCEQSVVEFGEVTVERFEITALDEEVVAGAAKHNGSESVPLRLEEVARSHRNLFGHLGKHRLDGRRQHGN